MTKKLHNFRFGKTQRTQMRVIAEHLDTKNMTEVLRFALREVSQRITCEAIEAIERPKIPIDTAKLVTGS